MTETSRLVLGLIMVSLNEVRFGVHPRNFL